jgi:AcrR family transcriptional regulator
MTRRRRDSQASRERILQSAIELISERGYSGAGVDELAARSDIAKTAIYYHFGSKEGLLAAVLERAATAWIDGIQQAASQAGTPLERLDRGLAGMRAVIEERPWIFKLIQILALEVAEQKPEIRATLRAIILRAREALVTGMRDALGVDLPDAEVIAGVVLALLDGIALGRQLDPGEISLDRWFAELRALVVFMVASRVNPDGVAALLQGAIAATPGGSAAPAPSSVPQTDDE